MISQQYYGNKDSKVRWDLTAKYIISENRFSIDLGKLGISRERNEIKTQHNDFHFLSSSSTQTRHYFRSKNLGNPSFVLSVSWHTGYREKESERESQIWIEYECDIEWVCWQPPTKCTQILEQATNKQWNEQANKQTNKLTNKCDQIFVLPGGDQTQLEAIKCLLW